MEPHVGPNTGREIGAPSAQILDQVLDDIDAFPSLRSCESLIHLSTKIDRTAKATPTKTNVQTYVRMLYGCGTEKIRAKLPLSLLGQPS